ncbi:hypothetical protein [Streptomyces chrestomyceticus]|uniref:hypothetical protein n=1 Tax=Streptomyces chrestomyceticus TaxID=68185 RepID=UPI0033DB7A46
MVKKQRKKGRDKRRAERTGAARASAATGNVHSHTPLPDLTLLADLPYGAGRELNLDLAARLLAACFAACQPCQRTLAKKLRSEQRPTLAALAGAVFGSVPAVGVFTSPTTRSWAPLARAAAGAHSAAMTDGRALAAVEAMDDEAASDLLEDTLDMWAVGTPEKVADLLQALRSPEAPPRPADPLDAFREAGVKVVTLDDLDLPEVPDAVPHYSVVLTRKFMPDGRPLPMLTLVCEGAGAGIADLRARTDWAPWDLRRLPELDVNWRVRVDIASRTLRCLVHTDAEGDDDHRLWAAAEDVRLPDTYWNLLDTAQHVLVAGPLKDGRDESELKTAADAGELLAVVARVSFQ